MRVTANTDVCVGAGQCVHAAPAVFDQSDDGLVVLRIREITDEHADAVRDAVEWCPSGAIALPAHRGEHL
ncbi:ferredoxin [Catenuloplanes indicus]|uniref:Ferredoxin n=1 Tax=Catenuloplanes indicus TaxID=137267 RepID=A0AAE3VTU3_9ACTN|nr:ferredoxin [Catenuloplanes indicus]MDQ0363545.1 ferredoxin [Catenuloplanes indicus]